MENRTSTTERDAISRRIFFLVALLCLAVSSVHAEFSFTHPGLLHSRDDLERMRAAVAAKSQPTFAGFEVFRADPASQASYRMKGPFEEIGRAPGVYATEFDQDANAAYQCAVMWAITRNRAYAEKSITIVNGWSATLQRCTGADAVLMAGLGPFKLINAAEILRYTDAGWSDADARRCERMFKEVIYPVTKDFALFANGNWDAAAMRMNLSIGVFCNDRDIFERALRYYVNGAGNGRLTHYVINDAGQCQESGRDQPHTQLGLALLGDCCEIAWHQGLNLYGYADNRLLKGFEYTAKYNLGEDVPFTETIDRTGKYHHTMISRDGRGRLRAVYEEIYNHYVNRAGLAAPWTTKAAGKIRPEGPGLPAADHPGFGTLFFTLPRDVVIRRPLKSPTAPAAIIAQGSTAGIKLSWIAPEGTASHTVMRTEASSGKFEVIAKGWKSSELLDRKVSPGEMYSYMVYASNAAGESPASLLTSVCAGLPPSWTDGDIGAVTVGGGANFDGATFTMEGAGSDVGLANDQFHFAGAPLEGDGTIVARFVPQVSSQFSKFGLMIRESAAAGAANVSLLISPRSGEGGLERPEWSASIAVRPSAGATTSIVHGEDLPPPFVSNGRLLEPYWLKLERRRNIFTGSISSDGQNWTAVGWTTVSPVRPMFIGLAVCSRLKTVTTRVQFDHVAISGNPK
jgi:hypothetical protein